AWVRVELRRLKTLRKPGLDRNLAAAAAFKDVRHHIVGARFGGELGQEFFRVGAVVGHLYEGVLLHEARAQRPQHLIDDERRIENDLTFLPGTLDELLLTIR